jgi:hypothetical protein
VTLGTGSMNAMSNYNEYRYMIYEGIGGNKQGIARLVACFAFYNTSSVTEPYSHLKNSTYISVIPRVIQLPSLSLFIFPSIIF